jgi:hypothetical protein
LNLLAWKRIRGRSTCFRHSKNLLVPGKLKRSQGIAVIDEITIAMYKEERRKNTAKDYTTKKMEVFKKKNRNPSYG